MGGQRQRRRTVSHALGLVTWIRPDGDIDEFTSTVAGRLAFREERETSFRGEWNVRRPEPVD